ncbi:MAG: hypothetical protein IT343_02510 [Candidatus Melainabacteria bacterium]|jgi:hypothetical protein|nr:hypothetical protein [Candidatus Melainabacteria bacterium]
MLTSATTDWSNDSQASGQMAIRSWIATNYPSLDVESLSDRIFKKATQRLDEISASKDASPTQAEREALEKALQGAVALHPFVDAGLIDSVKEEFESMVKVAFQAGFEGEQVRSFLGLLLTADGFPLVSELRSWGQERSLDIFLELARDGLFISQISHHVFGALARTTTVRPALRQKLLVVFDFITASANCPSHQSCAETLKNALLLEVGRLPADVDETVAVAILDRIMSFPDPEIFPILDALIATSAMSGLRATRKHARFALDSLNASAQKIWDETTADLVSGLEDRSRMLERVGASTLTEEESAQIIVHAFKDREMEIDSDPRLGQLNRALQSNASLVNLTASLAAVVQTEKGLLSEEGTAFEEVLQNAGEKLASIAINNENPRFRTEAITLLARLEKVSPRLEKMVAEKKEQASLMFVSRQQPQS